MKNITLFLKKNAVYLIVAFCVLAVGLTVLLVAISGNNDKAIDNGKIVLNQDEDLNPVVNPDDQGSDVVITPPAPTENPASTTIIFDMPVSSYTSVESYYDVPVSNSTLGRFAAHKAMDFFAEEGTNVFAAYDGKVESVTNNILTGFTIVIDHGNGLKTTYNSLQDGDKVVAGQMVKKGDIIGAVSVSNRQEYKSGAHLHFEVTENGKAVDPASYLLIEDK